MKDKEKHIVLGQGEVGQAIHEILKKRFQVSIRDKDSELRGQFDVLHICYPPVRDFLKITKGYIKQYRPKLVIVHSTVPVGMTRKIGSFAVHSPIRGVHPHLVKGIMTFVKYFGGSQAKKAAAYFSAVGIKTKSFPRPETTELIKILDTTYYGWNIIFCKESKRICDRLGLDFDDIYKSANQDYNVGYSKLGMANVVRPVLKPMPGKIGGHCVIQNTYLLKDWLTNTLKKRNLSY